MKKLLLVAIFALATTFGFASNTVHPAKAANTEQPQQAIMKNLIENMRFGEAGKWGLTFRPKSEKTPAEIDGIDDFNYIDPCGNEWYIFYWGITLAEALGILELMGYLLCLLNFFLILFP
jgi:hypothetical protein